MPKDLTPEQLNWKPGEDKWSIAQCFEHTLVGADRYAEKLGPAIEGARNNQLNVQADLQPRHTLMGRLILRAMEPTARRTMSAPKLFAPTQSPISEDIADRFVQSHENIAKLITDCDGLDHNRIKLSSRVARIIRINATDAFNILVTHAERHLNQADGVRQLSEFPNG
ncbi:MAG: DinB family protein [Candidatus Hydrogenedentota bacterium]